MRIIKNEEMEKLLRTQSEELNEITDMLNSSRIDAPLDTDPIVEKLDNINYNLILIADTLKVQQLVKQLHDLKWGD